MKKWVPTPEPHTFTQMLLFLVLAQLWLLHNPQPVGWEVGVYVLTLVAACVLLLRSLRRVARKDDDA